MENILHDLNQAVGILGSMILTKDGEYVIGETGASIDRAFGAALAADLVRGCSRNLSAIGKDNFKQCIMEAMDGKIVLYDAGPAYLFVIAEHRVHLNMTILDIQSAARRIHRELS